MLKTKINRIAISLFFIAITLLILALIFNIYFTLSYLFAIFISDLGNYSITGFSEVNIDWNSWPAVYWSVLYSLRMSLMFFL